MLKKDITYTNIDDVEVTETHHFHLSKADVIEMQFSKKEGLEAWLAKIGQSTEPKVIIEAFKELVERSYGIRNEAGKFVKNPQTTAEFMSSEAYSEFFVEIVTNAEAAAAFMNGIIPKGLDITAEKIQAEANRIESASSDTPALAKAGAALAPEEPKDPTGLTDSSTPRVLSPSEVAEMDADELKSGLATGRYKLS